MRRLAKGMEFHTKSHLPEEQPMGRIVAVSEGWCRGQLSECLVRVRIVFHLCPSQAGGGGLNATLRSWGFVLRAAAGQRRN